MLTEESVAVVRQVKGPAYNSGENLIFFRKLAQVDASRCKLAQPDADQWIIGSWINVQEQRPEGTESLPRGHPPK
jgi:hypothetical protein